MMTSTRRIGLVAGAVVAVLVIAWYAALFRPQSAHLKAAHAAYAKTEDQIHSLQNQVVALQAVERQIPADQARLQVLNQAVPTTADLNDVLDQLHTLASADGVLLQTLDPTNPTASGSSSASSSSSAGGARSISVTMTVTGPYPALMAFFTGLDQMPRTLVIDSAAFTTGSTGGVAANLTTRIFYAG